MARGGITGRAWTVGSTFVRNLAHRSEPLPRRIRTAFAELGPTYVKVGQVIASSPGLFPPEWTEEFASLRDRVPPFPGDQARQIIEDDLGRSIESAFGEFDDVPIASASIGQVHLARLRDGQKVAVKVQYPGIEEIVRRDLNTLRRIFRIVEWFIPYQGLDELYREIRAIVQ